MQNDRQFLISGHHTRLSRMWQGFFAGWGIFFTIALIASPFVFKNITWTLLDIVDMESIKQNNLSISNLKLNGTNKDGNVFHIKAKNTTQTYENPNVIYFESPIADTIRVVNNKKINDHIIADKGRLLLKSKKVILSDNVSIKSSDGSSSKTKEMEIDLK